MDRREVLKRVGILMGGTLSAPAIASILSGCQPTQKLDWTPVFFTEEQATLLAELTELIIPTTDTPGAKAAHVPEFIDLALQKCYSQEEQQAFVEGLNTLNGECQEQFGDSFLKCTLEQQKEALTQNAEKAQSTSEDPSAKKAFFFQLKELTLLGYFTSEPGATQALEYLAIPGEFNPCFTIEEGQKAWAT
ncbi:gluconate 2-dehydrogenase subunit 3 family protein [Rapidithrix thailandica]|uniref:Gluconate 2-dehydrogenase subunit 3 family protein n=1 Tax=Rapidithrix thailandica TaxID=413964 RepID=A0AAW9S4C1_9BACT